MAAILSGSSFKLAVTGTYGERGLCCLYNPCIFLPILYLFKVMSVRQLCLSRMNQKNKDSGRILIIIVPREQILSVLKRIS